MKLEEALALYLKETPPKLQAVYRIALPKFAHFMAGIEIAEVTSQHLLDFQQDLLWRMSPTGKLYKSNSVDQFLRRVRRFLRWAHAQGLIAVDPSANLLLPRPIQPTRSLLSWEELQELFSVLDHDDAQQLRDAVLLRLLTETDLGLGHCLDLRLGCSLALETGSQLLLDSYLDWARPRIAGFSADPALFLGRGGRALGRQAAHLRLQRAARMIGLSGLTARALRASYTAHFDREARVRNSSFNPETPTDGGFVID